MSYIIGNTNPFISTKLTERGRELLAKGQLTFGFWSIGDSEINYEREALYDSNPSDAVTGKDAKVLRPKDKQPNLKYYIHKGGTTPLNQLTNDSIRTLKLLVNNKADERGFFSGNMAAGFTTKSTGFVKGVGMISAVDLSGGTTVDIYSTDVEVGDFMLIKLGVDDYSNDEPRPHLWYKVMGVTGSVVTVDRKLPKVSQGDSTVLIYSSDEVHNGFGHNSTFPYWDTGTLSFDSSCDITREDVPVWNQNNVYFEGLAGTTGTSYESYSRFGSYEYLGLMKEYLEMGNNFRTAQEQSNSCDDIAGISTIDRYNKASLVIHYTNNTISNLYGEFFHIDDSTGKTVKLHLPDLMYHRREFSGGTASGTSMGMTFIASGGTKYIGETDIEYVDLIEDPTYLITREPMVVGKVFPQLKIIVVENEELVAAMSYKSNRNWTLPELSASLSNPVGGSTTGLLKPYETMYITYTLEDGTSGLTTSLPCQIYSKITNTLSTTKDVEFKIAETDLLPYMRKAEIGNNIGFHGFKFKVVYQIVSDDSRPDPNNWKVANFTTSAITDSVGASINPLLLENQNPLFNNQVLTMAVDSSATQFDITQSLSMAPITSPDVLQFGDERFFYGNVEAYIGATIFKTLFDIRIDSGQFNKTTNPTRSQDILTNPPAIKVSEVGIYDNNGELVLIGKISKPIKLVSGQTIMIELGMDF